jgi:hypothetical protein
LQTAVVAVAVAEMALPKIMPLELQVLPVL